VWNPSTSGDDHWLFHQVATGGAKPPPSVSARTDAADAPVYRNLAGKSSARNAVTGENIRVSGTSPTV
jgi:hypothetical protein